MSSVSDDEPGITPEAQPLHQQVAQLHLASPVILKPEQRNIVRLLLIIDEIARPIMERVFIKGAPRKSQNDTLKDYLINVKGMSRTVYRNQFNRSFREKIDSDPSCKSFDVSLWLPAIEWGCDGLALAGTREWFEVPETLENHLKRIKDLRNDVKHGEFSMSTEDFSLKIEEVRDLLTQTTELTWQKYGGDDASLNQVLGDLNTSINNIRDSTLTRVNLENYEYSALFKDLQRILIEKGRSDLIELFRRMSHVNPASFIAGRDIQLKVELIFTELEIIRGRDEDNVKIEYTDILQYSHRVKEEEGSCMGQIILIEGNAGVGKTTLVKLLLSSWASESDLVKELDKYKFVIHTECKNSSISSFNELISFQMPSARKSFRENTHMVECLLDLPSLIIVDGLDELNMASTHLFRNIININKNENITLICTTRPEKVEEYYQMIPDDVSTVHIKIKGVPETSMESFIVKYHETLRDRGDSQQDTEDLLRYFQSTGAQLQSHWKLPLNLSLLVLMWAVDPSRVNSVTTATELYKQIHELTVEKLLKRLAMHPLTQSFDPAKLRKNINVYITALGKEALFGLRDNAISLKEEAILNLQELCTTLSLPSKEALGAFLTQNIIEMQNVYSSQSSFPHKGQQDFYASLFLYENVMTTSSPVDVEGITKGFMECLSAHDVPPLICQDVIRTSSDKLKAIRHNPKNILDVLRDAYEADSEEIPLHKFQNVFILLIGLFYHADEELGEHIAEELVELLQRSGVKGRDAWIKILSSVKCNDTIAQLISRIPVIWKGNVKISDADVSAYATLLKNKRLKGIKIEMKTNPNDVPRFDELLRSITQHSSQVKEFCMEYLFHHSHRSLADTPLEESVNQIMERGTLEVYKGSVTANMNLPRSISVLYASVADSSSYLALQQFLQLEPKLINLRVCISHNIDPSILQPLPSEDYFLLYVPDVTNEIEINRASQIIKKLQPTEGRKMFSQILFPRSNLTQENQRALIMSLSGVRVNWALHFPSSCQPTTNEGKVEIKELARQILNCSHDVKWGAYGIHEWE